MTKTLLSISALLVVASLTLAGCGVATSSSVVAVSTTPASTIHGMVHGGQNPISGATIQLYAVNTTTTAGASTPLITTTTVTTGSDGSFNITGLYNNCLTSQGIAATDVYLVAGGGNPGLSTSAGPVNNAVAIMMVALGPCSGLSASTNITIDEVTTAAAVFALQSSMTDSQHVGSTSQNAAALDASFTLAQQLANTATGAAGGVGVPANQYVPIAKINTIADILSACVNTNGVTTNPSGCYSVFNATRRNGMNSTDTVVAAYNMFVVEQNITQTYNVLQPMPPFQPTLQGAPTSWATPLAAVYWATPSAIGYGTAISNTQDNASASVAGTFSYSVPTGTVLPVGTQTLGVTFTPSDSADYPTIAGSVNLTVNQGTPVITWAQSSITYGTPLSSTQLNATANVAGSFSYSSPTGTILPAGNNYVIATFTPNDTTDYAGAAKSENVQVAKANPAITWSAPAGVNFPTALTSTQLNASTPVAGNFVYTPVLGAIMAPGSQTLKVVFTPSDSADYNTVTVTQPWTVTLNSPLVAQCNSTFNGTSTTQVLTRTLCLWGLQDAASLTASGDSNGATNVTTDVQNLISGTTVFSLPSSFPANYVPVIPSFSTNPLAQAAEAHYVPIVTGEETVPFVPFVPFTSSVPFNDALELMEGFLTPSSALYESSYAMTSILNRVENGYLGLGTSSNAATGAFGQVNEEGELYLLMQKVFPSIMLPSRSAVWLSNLNANNQVEISGNGTALANATLGTAYENNDVRVATSIAYVDMINGTTANTAMYVTPYYNVVPQIIEPDGGTNYIYYENEDFTYHSASVTTIARYYQITGAASLASIMQQFKTYFALQITQPSTPVAGGSMVAEYYTAPAWKKYWNQVTSSDSIPIVAGLENDTLSAAMLANCGTDDSYRIASYYNSSVVPATIPANFITYDANVIGVRMKQGNFTSAMTTRTTPGDNGKTSYVGGMTLDDPSVAVSKTWPLNAAVEEATTQVLLETDAALQASLVGADYVSANIKLVNLKGNETVAQTTTGTFGASTAMYQLAAYDGQPTNWYGEEMWIGTPYRSIGVVRVMTTTAQSDYELNGDIRLVSGMGSGGVQRPLTQTAGTNIWTFGTMDVNLIAHDYATVATELSNTWGDTAQKAAYLKMKDAHDSTGAAYTWPAGTSHYYFAEFYPNWNTASSSPQVLTGLAAGLDGFSFVEADGHTYTLLFNKTTSAISYSPATNATVYPAGIQVRAPFLPQGSYPQSQSYSGSIPPQSFIVLVQ